VDIHIFSLELFLAVCDEGSFSKAGRRFFLSEPSVGARIRQLEDYLGFPLFARSRRGVELTDAGRVFRSHVAPSLERLQTAVEESRDAARRNVSRLTLWASQSTLTHLLPGMLAEFGREHGEVEIAVRSAQPEQVLPQLVSGSIDCAIVHEPERPHLAGYNEVELFRNVVGLVVAPGHPLAHKARLSLEDLGDHCLLRYEQARGYWPLIEQALRSSGLMPRETLSIESLYGLKELAKQGQGIVFLGLSMVLEEVQQGQLVFLPLQTRPGQMVENPAWFCYSRKHRLKRELDDLAGVAVARAAVLQGRLNAALAQTDGFLEFNPAGHLAAEPA
jgi:DNA-binding transcriptional LysR family regulator